MPLTGISNRGLALIAVLVVILWGCIFAERAIVRQAYEETQNVLRSQPEVRVKQQRPVALPPQRVQVPFV
jgi:hypothetical protein